MSDNYSTSESITKRQGAAIARAIGNENEALKLESEAYHLENLEWHRQTDAILRSYFAKIVIFAYKWCVLGSLYVLFMLIRQIGVAGCSVLPFERKRDWTLGKKLISFALAVAVYSALLFIILCIIFEMTLGEMIERLSQIAV